MDLKGSLGGLPEFGDLYFDARGLPQSSTFGKDPSSQLWAGEVVVQKEEPRRRNDFQKEMDAWENINVVSGTECPSWKQGFVSSSPGRCTIDLFPPS